MRFPDAAVETAAEPPKLPGAFPETRLQRYHPPYRHLPLISFFDQAPARYPIFGYGEVQNGPNLILPMVVQGGRWRSRGPDRAPT